jgi:hypothetical protein
MKIIVVTSLILLATGLSVPKTVQAQGTTYLSNLGQASTGSTPIGSDSWFGASFSTGTNLNGFFLDSIQLGMNDATGTPSGFTVLLYSVATGASLPGHLLATFSGSSTPSTAGIYTFTAPPNLIVAYSAYFIVATGGIPAANGAYEWSLSGINSYNPTDDWGIAPPTPFVQSSDGRNWNPVYGTYPQFAINATAVPEPGTLGLIALAGLYLIWLKNQKSSA